MGHQPNQTLKRKLKRDTKQRTWDTYQGETKMGHLPNMTSKLIIKCDTRMIKWNIRQTKWNTNKLDTEVET